MCQETNLKGSVASRGEAISDQLSQHYKSCLGIAQRILRSREDSEDAVQSAYCAALLHLEGFRGESSFKTWLSRIVVNCCLMQLRERRTRRQVAIEEVQHRLASHTMTPERSCYLGEIRTAHRIAVAGLPQHLRDMYVPCCIAGRALPAVARQLGLSTPAAKSRLYRARKRMEPALESVLPRKAA